MALVPCRKCGASIAESAVQCPKCGELDPASPSVQPKKKNVLRRGLAIVAVALVAAIALIVLVPSLVHDSTQEKQAKAAQSKADAALRSFIRDYGDRYSDPVSTYQAEEAYEASHSDGPNNGGLLITQETIANYDMSASMDLSGSPLGFEGYKLPLSAKADRATSMEIFNNYTCKEMSLYMNLLARNSNNPDAVAIIDFEISHWCASNWGQSSPENAQIDDTSMQTMMETAKSVVAEYGSAANYTVAPGSATEGDPNFTYFDPNLSPDVLGLDEDHNVTKLQDYADVAILVDTYSRGSVFHETHTLKNFQLFVDRQDPFPGDDFTMISIGQTANSGY